MQYAVIAVYLSCNMPAKQAAAPAGQAVSVNNIAHNHILLALPDSANFVTHINIGKTNPTELLAFASTLKGIPYQDASTDPSFGFDCSGFVAYVFNHFDIAVPRSSVDYTYMHRQIRLSDARPGDLVLFTGTDSTVRVVGHMGIVTAHPGDTIKFIHSTSGKARGVTVTALNGYYAGRYIKTVRVFEKSNK